MIKVNGLNKHIDDKLKLSPMALAVLEYLEQYGYGKDNAVFGKTLANELLTKPRTIRLAIKEIREETDIIIGADTAVGYYLPLIDELEKANQYRQNKALSELKGNAINDYNFILKAYRVLNNAVKTLDEKEQARLFEDMRKIGE